MWMPVVRASNVLQSVMVMFTPEQGWLAKTLVVGVKRRGRKRTPGSSRALRWVASSGPFNQGAPMISNGVSVPRPTDRLVVSSRPIPG
jgi:hypothetical protein